MRTLDRLFARVGNIGILHVGEERCWNVVDDTAKDVTGKLSYWPTRIVEVEKVSATD